ncbi:MAG: hypothetical protein ACREFW_06090 [Rhizomicrobium sp.]
MAVFLLAGSAADPGALFALYAQGRYQEAMDRGEAGGTGAGMAIAARAALADAMMAPSPCLPCLRRGEKDARRAITLDPRLADGHVWLAASLGYEARIQGVVWASLRDAPDEAKIELERALALDPVNPYALAALGGWHTEVVRVAGRYLARRLFDASSEQAVALFDHAVRADPRNVAVHYQIALALAGLNQAAYRTRVKSELEAAAADPPQTAYEKFIAARARILLQLLESEDRDAFRTKLRAFQGYP